MFLTVHGRRSERWQRDKKQRRQLNCNSLRSFLNRNGKFSRYLTTQLLRRRAQNIGNESFVTFCLAGFCCCKDCFTTFYQPKLVSKNSCYSLWTEYYLCSNWGCHSFFYYFQNIGNIPFSYNQLSYSQFVKKTT